nr:hypothetical protein [Tanacetum cinerariifolium]
IESSAKNLLPIPSEYEVTSDDESECDVPVNDESSPGFTTFSNLLFDCNDDFTSSDNESLPDEDAQIEEFKVYSNPLLNDEEINYDKLDPHCFNAGTDLVKSLSNHDTLIDFSLKLDYLEEFFGALMPTSIADEERIKREHAEYISLMERLFSINSVPHPLENFQSNTIVEILPTPPISNMEDTMLELVEVCLQKEFYCMHNNIDDLIKSALNSKLLSINLDSQRLDKKKHEVKNIVEQPTKCGTRIALQTFKVKKSSISLNNTSQISLVHAITPVFPTEEPEYSLSMGYEHLSIIPETKFDEVIESSAKNLLPIPSEYEVTSDDESECDVPVKDESSPDFTTFSNLLFDCNDDFTSSDNESLPDEDAPIEEFKVYSNPLLNDEEINYDKLDPHCFNAETDLVKSLSNHDTLIDFSPKLDYLEEFFGALMPTSIADEERIRREHAEYISLMEREEINIFTGTDELLPLSIESDDYDSKGDINDLTPQRLKSLLFDVEFFFDFEPDAGEVISAVMNDIDELNEDECFNPRGEIDVFKNVEDDDYFPFMFVIRIFLPYLIYPEVSPLLLS